MASSTDALVVDFATVDNQPIEADGDWMNVSETKKIRLLYADNGAIVDFRQMNDYGFMMPDKGITVSFSEMKTFHLHLSILEKIFSSYVNTKEKNSLKIKISEDLYCSFDSQFPCIQLRRFYTDPTTQMLRATKTGISFKLREISALKNVLSSIDMKVTFSK